MTNIPAPAQPPQQQQGPINERIFSILALLGLALVGAMIFWRAEAFQFFVYDDTYIFLRYAQNFLDHGQLVWNLNEWVEGYTNPLHLVLITVLGACGVDLLDAARLINAASALGFAALLYGVFKNRTGWAAALFVAGLALANPPLIAWVWGGMEGPLSVLLLAAAQAVMMKLFFDPNRRTPRMAAIAAILFGLAFLNRPDNALYAVPAALAFLFWKDRRQFLTFCGVMAITVITHTLVRLVFYGDALPNTFYAKVVGTPFAIFKNGVGYVWMGLTTYPLYYAGGIAALGFLLLFRKNARAFALYGLSGILLSAAYIIYVGGDFMPGFRFMLPWLPIALLAIGLLLERAIQPLRYAGLLLCLLLMKALFVLAPDLQSVDGTALAGENVGRYIAKSWPRGSLIALNAAGAIPYFNMDKNFIDMLGLNDRTIAKRAMPDHGLEWQKKPGHGKGDGMYVLSRKPDFIILSSVAGDNGLATPEFASDYELKQNSDFKQCYKQERVVLEWPSIIRRHDASKGTEFPFSYYRRTCPK